MQRIIIILIILAIACFALAGVINKFEKRLKQKSAQRASVPPVSSSQTVQQRRMSASFKIEYPNRLRIYEDSKRLASSTKNFDVMKSRCDEIAGYYDWLQPFIDAGLPISANMSNDEAHAELRSFFNHHAVRIAKSIIESSDTVRKRKNKLSILENIKSQLRDARNTIECQTEIDALIRSIESE